jgi:hypothetical protein
MEDAMSWRLTVIPSLVAILCVGAAIEARAQGATGTITGTVYDNVGVVPGASVTATNSATGNVRTTTTNGVGLFRITALPPGRYTLKIEVQGFRPLNVEEFQLLAETRDFGRLVLQAGGVQETVSVIAQVTPVQVASSSRQQGITSDQIQNITMKGRDIYGFLTTLPGVQDTNLSRDFTDWNSAKLITINGAPVNNKNVMIDGIPQVDEGGTGNAYVNPNMDAIGEVQVVANGFTAENGRSNGGLVNFVTKSGTTSFKGAAWYNARRNAWNANDYVRLRQGQAKPLYRVNIGGFSFGGPVIIPKLLDSRTSERKVFFFISQEYTKDARPSVTATANYPTDLERMGDFSQTYRTTSSNYGTVQPIIDPETDKPFPGNIIPPDRINPIGQAMLNLMQKPNGYVPPGANQQYNANFIENLTPLHDRADYVFRGDIVMTRNLRFSGKLLADHEDNITTSAFGPGFGRANNFVPGWLVGATATYVINPTTVNETNGAFAINHYGFRGYPDGVDYTQYYCANLGVCPPRITPYGQNDNYHPDAPPKNCCALKQADQYPYIAMFSTAGGDRTGLANYNPGASNGRVMPTSNHNWRYVFQDDLSKTVGRHALKFGVFSELDSKTEPGTTNYMGNFNFGSSSNNPRDTGNGYANMLLGVITTYTEATRRVDKDVRHWQNEAYAQDSWRINPRLTIDYGVRFTHSGSWFETNNSTAAFFPELYDRSQAPRIYMQACRTGAAGNLACSASNQAAIDPANPGVYLPFQLAGTIVPGSGDPINGMKQNERGSYYKYPALLVAPRFGLAWDINGDGRSALRMSAGVFYNFPRGGQQFVGNPPVTFNQVVNNITMDQLAAYSSGGSQLTFTQNPINSGVAFTEPKQYELPLAYNANLAYQRDVGFSTVVEVAYVGNWITNDTRTFDLELFPYSFYADPAHQFNRAPLSVNYFKSLFPGTGRITDFTNDYTTLAYNALQLSVQRRLSGGLQLGLAYTLSKGMGMQGYDEYTADPNLTIPNVGGVRAGGEEALHDRYWGPTNVDRRHNLTFNYSYQIPSPVQSGILKVLLSDWQISGVTKWITGTTVNPTCSPASSVRGIEYTDPTLTPSGNGTGTIAERCDLTGEPINAGVRVDPDPANPDILTAQWFNLDAFKLATAVNGVGNFGNAPLGLLRNPSFSNWDLTLARRIPVKLGRNGGVRVQLQAYNVFNQVRFTTLNAGLQFSGATATTQSSNTAGRYSTSANPSVIPPRQIGLTVRLDF